MYNILITSGERGERDPNSIFGLKINNITEIRKYSSHLWVHNGVIVKNHIIPKSFNAIMKFVKASERGYQFI